MKGKALADLDAFEDVFEEELDAALSGFAAMGLLVLTHYIKVAVRWEKRGHSEVSLTIDIS